MKIIKLLKIITERDIIRTIAEKKRKNIETKLKIFMTKKVVYININYSLIEAIEILNHSGFRHLPIYDDKKLKFYGIISYKDFLIGNIILKMKNFYKPDYSLDPNSPFARDSDNKLIRKSYWNALTRIHQLFLCLIVELGLI